MYISLIPVIFAGILNMIWCKSSAFDFLARPLDNNKHLRDGKRIFGENKTWKGFFGMVLFGALSTILWGMLWGMLCKQIPFLQLHNYLYVNFDNTLQYNLIIGSLFGLAYSICELPNSFIKRRFNIIPGKRANGAKGVLFTFVDQVDSIVGCVFVLNFVYKMSAIFFLFFVLLGAGTHIIVNIVLYSCKLRKNIF